MIIGGVEKLSFVDYPGHLATVVFTKSCNFRCHFCYNPMLVFAQNEDELRNIDEGSSLISEEDLFLYLKDRKGKIDAVVISGGEPTLQADLKDFVTNLKKLDYKVKLDTNGTNPDKVQELMNLNLLDYIAMDIKAPLDSYEKVVGLKTDIDKISKSIKILLESNIPYEFRTTLVPSLVDEGDIEKMAQDIKGANLWYLQKFKSDIDLVDQDFKNQSAFSDQDMKKFEKIGSNYVKKCVFRD